MDVSTVSTSKWHQLRMHFVKRASLVLFQILIKESAYLVGDLRWLQELMLHVTGVVSEWSLMNLQHRAASAHQIEFPVRKTLSALPVAKESCRIHIRVSAMNVNHISLQRRDIQNAKHAVTATFLRRPKIAASTVPSTK
eukprot:gb/GECG01008500.1/.p1 GENE.gb/GECG01008500.1/~~gb/GECG01008500.1/.p1  ORF type:complete len:139 (+),score=15.09 gb/GECG01008500.1/:1-417(+)